MHSLKNTFFSVLVMAYLLLGASASIQGQTADIQLDEVRILGLRRTDNSTSVHSIRIDSVLKSKYFGSDLSQVLQRETNLNITQYGGQGSLASLRLRGSAPSQTQINWNGIPVNSPTTGSIDLSLLSGGMADAIEVAYGASGSLFGNGTFGGSINLFNKPDWDNRLCVNLAGEMGSWNHYKTGIGVRAGGDSFQYHLTGLNQSSPNTFRYRNSFKTGNPIEYRTNDSMNLQTVQQHLFFRMPKNWFLQYGFWWHNRSKQLPAPMSSNPTFSATQKDQSLRQFVRATKLFRQSSLEMVAASFTDSLFYGESDKETNFIQKSSGIRSSNTYLSVYYRWFISDRFTLENGADYEYQTAKVQAYNGLAVESRGAAFSQLKYNSKPVAANFSYRQVFYSMTGPKSLFSASVQYSIAASGLSVKGQISNKYRFPTLNDRYWQPGGNPDLLPEKGMGYDAGLVWEVLRGDKSRLTLSSLLFVQQINNWIQWVPTGTYWSPQNIRMVRCQGLEINFLAQKKLGSFDLYFKGFYSYTESLDLSLKTEESRFARQMAYVPFHLVKIQSGVAFKWFEAALSYKYAGRRFTTDNHDPWLDLNPYHVADFSFGYTFLTKQNKIVVLANIYNLFDVSYNLIRSYPAPGRSFYVSVNYIFNKNR